jgi:hypothetical protein
MRLLSTSSDTSTGAHLFPPTNKRRRNPPQRVADAYGKAPHSKAGTGEAQVSEKKGSRENKKSWSVLHANKEMALLRRRAAQLEALPPVWSAEMEVTMKDEREALYSDTKRWLDRMQYTIQKDPRSFMAGKTRLELSSLLGHALSIFSEIPPDVEGTRSPFSHCWDILTLLDDLNLEPQPSHYAAAVATAVRESKWTDASDLFTLQIDPDGSGYVPMGSEKDICLGLYAIAERAKLENIPSAELVMDAVLRMSMVSPSDQDKHVFCAGTALGRAGEWQACIKYLRNSYNSTRLGQALIAAAMQACILCSQHEEALVLFDELVVGREGGEYQWGGQFDGPNPICRDLIIRALAESPNEDAPERALAYFDEIQDERRQISVDALRAIFRILERQGLFRESTALLSDSLEQKWQTSWLVDSDKYDLDEIKADSGEIDRSGMQSYQRCLPEILATVMRTCNSSEQYGLALVSCRLAEVFSTKTLPDDTSLPLDDEASHLERSLLLSNIGFGLREDLLIASMLSLNGLGLTKYAARLYESAKIFRNEAGNEASHPWTDAMQCYESVRSNVSEQNAWESAHKHIHRIFAAVEAIKKTGIDLSVERKDIITSALAKTMHCCTAVGQPEASLFIATHVEPVLSVRQASSFGGSISSFLGLNSDDEASSVLLTDDLLLAEILRAHRNSSGSHYALELIRGLPQWDKLMSLDKGSSSSGCSIPLTIEVLNILVEQQRVDDALRLFRSLASESRSPESFLIVAKLLVRQRDWSSLGELYHQALKSNCLTELLSEIAIKAVAESNVETKGKLRAARNIAEEASRIVGISQTKWLEHRYWSLKRRLGRHFTRLLMWWNDAKTSQAHEFQLAMKQFEQRRELGLKPKNDVVRAIVSGAQDFKQLLAARNIMEKVASIPEDVSGWIDLLCYVLDETKGTPLYSDPRFVDDVAMAFSSLEAHGECVDFVSDAVARNVYVNYKALERALFAAEQQGSAPTNLQLLASKAS